MLQWFRARSRALAVWLLVSIGTLGASSVALHGDGCHESLCAIVVQHDASDHGIRAYSANPEHALDCVVCHWTRLLRPTIEVVRQFAPAVQDDGRVTVETVNVSPVFPAAQPPLRSPPVSPARFV